ncbi:MAG: MFS transporter [Oscillospiraceae bacterium]|nr:MFS transporter [Oscillospiraceae bacterium]
MKDPKKKIHYGWVVVFACFMILCFGVCIISNCVGLFVKPVTEAMGISRKAFSVNQTIISIAMMGVSLLTGWVFSRFKTKAVMCLSAVVMCVSYGLYALAPNIYVFYVISAVVGFSMGFSSSIPISLLITRWFNEKRGTALSLAFMGTGLGGVIMSPVIGWLLETVGWRLTYGILGVLMFVCIVPVTFLLIRSDPEEKGLEPYGGHRTEAGENSSHPAEKEGITLKAAQKTPQFWFWFFGVMAFSITSTGTVQHVAAYVSDIGYTAMIAANISAVNLGLLAAGKLLLGQVADRVHVKKVSFLCMGAMVGCMVCLILAKNVILLFCGLALFGFSAAYVTIAYPLVTSELFGKKEYGAIYGRVMLGANIGQAISALLMGGIYDAFGSYVPAWFLMIGLSVFNIFNVMSMFRGKKKGVPA